MMYDQRKQAALCLEELVNNIKESQSMSSHNPKAHKGAMSLSKFYFILENAMYRIMHVNSDVSLSCMFPRKQTHTHARTHARTHAHTHTHTHTSVYTTPIHPRTKTCTAFKLHVLLSTWQQDATSLQQYPAGASSNDTHVPSRIRSDDSRGKRQFVDTLRSGHNVDVVGTGEIRSDDVRFDRHHLVCWVVDVQL